MYTIQKLNKLYKTKNTKTTFIKMKINNLTNQLNCANILKKDKNNIKNTLSNLKILNNMTNFEQLWELMKHTLIEKYPEPTYLTRYKACQQANTSDAYIKAGVKDGFIREDENKNVAIQDVEFYTGLREMFSKAKTKNIIQDTEIMGFKKYRVVNYKVAGKTETKYQTEKLLEFVDEVLQFQFGKTLDQLTKKA